MEFFKEIPTEENIGINKPTDVSVPFRAEKLGAGSYGTVIKVPVYDKKGKNRASFAVKLFEHGSLKFKNPDENAMYSIKMHTILKDNGVKTFPTYRISSDKSKILMTYGSQKGWQIHLVNAQGEYVKKYSHISEIKDVDSFFSSVYENAVKASEAGIELPYDSYYFFSKKIDGNPDIRELDFVIGDLDLITYVDKLNGSQQSFIRQKNIEKAAEALRVFIWQHVKDKKSFEYEQKIDKIFKS